MGNLQRHDNIALSVLNGSRYFKLVCFCLLKMISSVLDKLRDHSHSPNRLIILYRYMKRT